MAINKKIIYPVVLAGIFGLANLTLADITSPIGPTSFTSLLTKMAGIVGGLIAGIGTIMFSISGIYYVTSGGSPERMGVAKKTLIWAIIGMTVGLSATAIVNWVASVTG